MTDQRLYLECDHFEYEFSKCKESTLSLSGGGVECAFYKTLMQECLNSTGKGTTSELLIEYERELIEKRAESKRNNDTWTYRKEPPADWNSNL
jgi:hypothetical protein